MANPAVLVVNWSTPDDLEKCLGSVRQHEGDVGVYVFQNHYNREVAEASLNTARRYGASWWQHMENLGHGAGINRLADQAKWHHDYLFIVNPDCVWTEPVMDTLIAFLEEDPKRCIVGPKQLDSKMKITAGGIFGTFEKPQHRMFKFPDAGNAQARDVLQATVVAGSAMMIRTADFVEYGGLLEANHYYSETWLCYHTAAHGRTNWYYGKVWMIHEWHRSSPIGSPLTDGKFHEDRALFRKMCDEHDPPIPHD